MSEELKNEDKKCFCQSKGFKTFLVVALGSFTGVYAALCLYTLMHRPPFLPPAMMGYGYGTAAPIAAPCPCRHMHKHHFDKGGKRERGAFQRFDGLNESPAPFEARKNVKNSKD